MIIAVINFGFAIFTHDYTPKYPCKLLVPNNATRELTMLSLDEKNCNLVAERCIEGTSDTLLNCVIEEGNPGMKIYVMKYDKR